MLDLFRNFATKQIEAADVLAALVSLHNNLLKHIPKVLSVPWLKRAVFMVSCVLQKGDLDCPRRMDL
jgi:hypothetical protein